MAQSLEVGYPSFRGDAYRRLPHAPDTSVSDRTPKVKQRSKLTTATNILTSFSIALGSYGCAVGPAGFVEAANLPPNPIVTLTGMPDSATGIAETPTPQEGVQEPTFVDVPFLLPTDIVPSLTPVTPEASLTPTLTQTATEIQPSATQESITPTATVTEIEQGDWFDEHFRLEKDLPPGSILMNRLPKTDRKKLVITAPGQVLGICGIQDTLRGCLRDNKILSSLHFDLSREDGKTCVYGTTSEKTIRNGISKEFPELPLLKQEELVNQYIQQSRNFMERLVNSSPERAFDIFEAFAFRNDYDESGNVIGISLHVISNPYPPTGEYIDRESITIPLFTSTPTSTP